MIRSARRCGEHADLAQRARCAGLGLGYARRNQGSGTERDEQLAAFFHAITYWDSLRVACGAQWRDSARG